LAVVVGQTFLSADGDDFPVDALKNGNGSPDTVEVTSLKAGRDISRKIIQGLLLAGL
jgi:hypothetical protein